MQIVVSRCKKIQKKYLLVGKNWDILFFIVSFWCALFYFWRKWNIDCIGKRIANTIQLFVFVFGYYGWWNWENFDQDLHRNPILWQMKIQLKLMLSIFFAPFSAFHHFLFIQNVCICVWNSWYALSAYFPFYFITTKENTSKETTAKKNWILFHQKAIRLKTIAFDLECGPMVWVILFQLFTRINIFAGKW